MAPSTLSRIRAARAGFRLLSRGAAGSPGLYFHTRLSSARCRCPSSPRQRRAAPRGSPPAPLGAAASAWGAAPAAKGSGTRERGVQPRSSAIPPARSLQPSSSSSSSSSSGHGDAKASGHRASGRPGLRSCRSRFPEFHVKPERSPSSSLKFFLGFFVVGCFLPVL